MLRKEEAVKLRAAHSGFRPHPGDQPVRARKTGLPIRTNTHP